MHETGTKILLRLYYFQETFVNTVSSLFAGGGGGRGWGRGGNVKRVLKVWFSVKKKLVNKSLIIQWYLCKINQSFVYNKTGSLKYNYTLPIISAWPPFVFKSFSYSQTLAGTTC